MPLQKDDELAAIIQKRGVQPESDTSLWACLSRFVSHEDGGPIPVQTLAANAGIFFAAGFETTAHAISWALFELAADPSIQVCLFVCLFVCLPAGLPACLPVCLPANLSVCWFVFVGLCACVYVTKSSAA